MHPIFEVGIRPQITQGFHAPSTFASIFNKNNPNIGIYFCPDFTQPQLEAHL